MYVQTGCRAIGRRAAVLAVAALGAFSARAAAQPAQAAPRTLTLDLALALAEETGEQLKVAEAGVLRARSDERRVHSEYLPQF